MSDIPEAVRAEVRRILPDVIKVGDLLPLSTGDHVRIEQLLPDGRYAYSLIKGSIEQVAKSKAAGTITMGSGPDITVASSSEIKKNVKNSDPFGWYIKKRLKY